MSDLTKIESEGKAFAVQALSQFLDLNKDVIGIEPPTTHHFGGGVYGRRMFMSKGDVVVGHKHKNACLNIIALGHVRVINVADNKMVSEHKAGQVFESPEGTERAIVALENSCWITCHPDSGERDQDRIKEDLTQ